LTVEADEHRSAAARDDGDATVHVVARDGDVDPDAETEDACGDAAAVGFLLLPSCGRFSPSTRCCRTGPPTCDSSPKKLDERNDVTIDS
jgi:hypothetical protein